MSKKNNKISTLIRTFALSRVCYQGAILGYFIAFLLLALQHYISGILMVILSLVLWIIGVTYEFKFVWKTLIQQEV